MKAAATHTFHTASRSLTRTATETVRPAQMETPRVTVLRNAQKGARVMQKQMSRLHK